MMIVRIFYAMESVHLMKWNQASYVWRTVMDLPRFFTSDSLAHATNPTAIEASHKKY